MIWWDLHIYKLKFQQNNMSARSHQPIRTYFELSLSNLSSFNGSILYNIFDLIYLKLEANDKFWLINKF